MKRLRKYLVFALMMFIIFNTCIYASTNTYIRTQNDLKINSNIKGPKSVKRDSLAHPNVDASDNVYDYNNFGKGTEVFASYGKSSSNDSYKIVGNRNYVKVDSKNNSPVSSMIAFVILMSFLSSTLFILGAYGKHKTIQKAIQAEHYLIKDSFKLTQKEDRFVNVYTSKVYNPPSSSSGGGSSSHR